MPKSLTELRAEKAARPLVRPSVPYKATVGAGQQYVAELQRLTAEHDEILATITERPRAMGESVPARVTEIRARMAELIDLMAEYEGEVAVTATATDGEWAQWRVEHPARTGDAPGAREDAVVAGGWCNSDDLIEDLPRYVTAWNGEPLGEGDFDALGLMRPDKKQIARLVIGLYEMGDDLGEWRRGLSAHLTSVTGSSSPSGSASASDGSSAGSPSSDTSTTTPTTD